MYFNIIQLDSVLNFFLVICDFSMPFNEIQLDLVFNFFLWVLMFQCLSMKFNWILTTFASSDLSMLFNEIQLDFISNYFWAWVVIFQFISMEFNWICSSCEFGYACEWRSIGFFLLLNCASVIMILYWIWLFQQYQILCSGIQLNTISVAKHCALEMNVFISTSTIKQH